MIDTVVIRIHNLKSKYDYFTKSLKKFSYQDKAVFKYNASETFKDSVKNFQYYADTDKVRFLSIRNSVYVYSSHYNINYNCNYERDFIELNLSVPKYYFGTNVFQFVDFRHIDIHHVYNKFEKFLLQLFNLLFPALPDYADVEINRLDMCYNQIFLTKDDALKYLVNIPTKVHHRFRGKVHQS